VVQVEEVGVEHGLDAAGHHGEKLLGVEAVEPVEDVEGAVAAQREQVVSCDRLRLACLWQQTQLR